VRPEAWAKRISPVSSSEAVPSVSIYKAERITGPDGTVERYGAPISEDDAILRLKSGDDIVVCSKNSKANRRKAWELTESAFLDSVEDEPHGGRMALPHFHPESRTPEVHAFFERGKRHARRRKE
jgi:hypothetical protein